MKRSNQPICPKCAAVIPDEAPGGLCPKCALEGVATAATTMFGTRKSTPPSIVEIAPYFPELEILELIGAGGMGAVYKARQPQLDRFVALKILSHHLAGDPTFVERFNREARVLARLNHPNIVGIHDFGTAGPYCFLTMELVDGVNLRQAMQAGRFTPSEALAMVQHLCSALKFAHEEGILHRDIKPENILIDSKGRVKIADFGIAKLVGEDREHDFTLTLQGAVLGSPHYMAPEQIETPGDVDQRADIYSLGVVLYEMLTGGLPLGRFALPSEKASMDARIDHIVMRTLEKEREARYQSAGDVSTEVEALGNSPAPPAMKAAASPAEPVAARFSLAAAILTGISIPLVIIVFVAFTMRLPGPSGPVAHVESGVSVGAILALLSALVTLCSALIGFLLGARALGEIRRSGGVKSGIGSSIFAVTAWPILVLLAVGQLFMKTPSPGEGGSIGPFMVIIVVLLPVLVSAWLLVRSLYRWAGGVERNDGTRFHPGFGMPVLIAMLLAIVGPVLLAGIAQRILPAGESREPFGDRGNSGLAVPPTDTARAKNEDWLLGRPEIVVPVRLLAGVRANFLLVQRNAKGGVTTTTIGQINAKTVETVMVKIGSFENHSSENESAANLRIMLSSASQSLTVSSTTSLSDWRFFQSPPEAPALAGGERREFELANRPETPESLAEVMHLVVETTLLDP